MGCIFSSMSASYLEKRPQGPTPKRRFSWSGSNDHTPTPSGDFDWLKRQKTKGQARILWHPHGGITSAPCVMRCLKIREQKIITLERCTTSCQESNVLNVT